MCFAKFYLKVCPFQIGRLQVSANHFHPQQLSSIQLKKKGSSNNYFKAKVDFALQPDSVRGQPVPKGSMRGWLQIVWPPSGWHTCNTQLTQGILFSCYPLEVDVAKVKSGKVSPRQVCALRSGLINSVSFKNTVLPPGTSAPAQVYPLVCHPPRYQARHSQHLSLSGAARPLGKKNGFKSMKRKWFPCVKSMPAPTLASSRGRQAARDAEEDFQTQSSAPPPKLPQDSPL